MDDMRNGILVLVAAVFAGVCVAADVDESARDQGIPLGSNGRISPYAELGVTYDSNVTLTPTNNSDIYVYERVGLLLSKETGVGMINMNLWTGWRQYQEMTDMNETDWGETLSYTATLFDHATLTLSQSYTKSQSDKDFLTDLIGDIRSLNLGLAYEDELTDRTRYALGYNTSGGEYNDANLFDWSSHSVLLGLQYLYSEETTLSSDLQVGLLSSEGFTNSAMTYSVRLGAQTVLTEKTAGGAGVSWMYVEGPPSVASPGVFGGLTWQAAETLSLGLTMDTAITPAVEYESNYIINYTTVLSASLALTERITASSNVGLHYHTYTEDVLHNDGSVGPLTVMVYTAGAALTYSPPWRYATLFTRIDWQSQESDLTDRDWTRTAVTAGIRLQY